jgi:hemolysin activation/secretion protein
MPSSIYNLSYISTYVMQTRISALFKIFSVYFFCCFAPYYIHAEDLVPICFQIKKLDIKGSKSLPKSELSKIKDKYENQCLNEVKINQLMRELTNKLIALGFITSRATIPEQDIKQGKLILEIKEGNIEEVQYKSKTTLTGDRSRVLPTLQGKALNLRDIEQAIDGLNRLKSNNAKVQILPGKTPGGSIVVIDNEPSKIWYVSTGIDNSGTKNKGIQQSFTNITLEDLLSSNEIYSFGTRYSLSNPNAKFTRSYFGAVSIPYGNYNINFATNHSSYRTYIMASTQSFKNKGISRVNKISIDRNIHRDSNSRTVASIGIGRDNYSNYIADTKIEISSYKIEKIEFSLNHQRRLEASVIGAGISYIHGVNRNYIKGWGSIITPNKKFNKVNLDLSWVKPLPIKPAYFYPIFTSSLHAQHSEQVLCGSEKILIGGLSSVRGFKEQGENSDNGVFIRNELALGLPENKAPHSVELIQDSELFFAYDAGRFRNYEERGEVSGSMSGAAAGIRATGGIIKFDLTFAKALSSKYIKRGPMEIYFNVALSV